MDVYLDGQAIQVEPCSVSRALDVARERAQEAGRIVIEVRVDGTPASGELLDRPPKDTGGISELRMLTAAPGPFVQETLLNAAELLDQTKSDQDDAAELIQRGSVEEAFAPLQRALQSWAVVQQILDRSQQLLSIDAGSVVVGDSTGMACISGLAERLKEVRRALAEEDWTALSDELAYEMDGQIDRWRQLLTALAGAAAVGEGGGSSG